MTIQNIHMILKRLSNGEYKNPCFAKNLRLAGPYFRSGPKPELAIAVSGVADRKTLPMHKWRKPLILWIKVILLGLKINSRFYF